MSLRYLRIRLTQSGCLGKVLILNVSVEILILYAMCCISLNGADAVREDQGRRSHAVTESYKLRAQKIKIEIGAGGKRLRNTLNPTFMIPLYPKRQAH